MSQQAAYRYADQREPVPFSTVSALPSTLGANAGLLSLPRMIARWGEQQRRTSCARTRRGAAWIATAAVVTDSRCRADPGSVFRSSARFWADERIGEKEVAVEIRRNAIHQRAAPRIRDLTRARLGRFTAVCGVYSSSRSKISSHRAKTVVAVSPPPALATP